MTATRATALLRQPPSPTKTGRRAAPLRRREWTPIGLFTPALVVVALVSLVPIIYAVRLSLYRTRALHLVNYNGLANFGTVVGRAGWPDIARTLVYVLVSLALTIPLGIGLAVLLNKKVRFVGAFRIVILLPWVVSQTVAGLLWKWLLNPRYGGLHEILGSHDILASAYGSMAALIVVNVWLSYPLATILSLAALQTVSHETTEASKVDGCSAFQSFRLVTLPSIKPTLQIVAIMLTLLYFNMVTLVYTLTGGGPFSGTQVLSLQAFLASFQYFKIGIGAAYSVVLFVFNVIFGLAYVRVLRSSE